jgi:hypothetical protein
VIVVAKVEFMVHHTLRPSLPIIALYGILSVFWVGLAYGLAPNIITAAYSERSVSILNWVFQGHRALPLEYYLSRWSMIAAALQIAMMLHLVIVLFIVGNDIKRPSSPKVALRANLVIIVFSGGFLVLTVLTEMFGDYANYVYEWSGVLDGHPWGIRGFNAYGPLFNALAPLAWVNPLANKLLFAFTYLVCLIWLLKAIAPGPKLVALSWSWIGLWLLNPFPWVNIVYFGYFDVLVAVACVAAVHSLLRSKDGLSGIYLGLGILLKFMPVVLLPFLVLSERRFHFRVLIYCAGVVILGFAIGVLLWGAATFLPLTFAASRTPQWLISIYERNSPLRLLWDAPNLVWLEKPFLLIAGLSLFAWCLRCKTGIALSTVLAVSVTLIFYRSGRINYQMVLLCLSLYWVASKWDQLKAHSILALSLTGYFVLLSFMQIAELSIWFDFTDDSYYGNIILFKFVLGCASLIGLIQFDRKMNSPLLSSIEEVGLMSPGHARAGAVE